MNKLSYLKSHKCGRIRRTQEVGNAPTLKLPEDGKTELSGAIIVKPDPSEVVGDNGAVTASYSNTVIPETVAHDNLASILGNTQNLPGLIASGQHVEIAMQNLVAPPMSEIHNMQVEVGQGDGRSTIDMSSYEGLHILAGAPSYTIPQTSHGQVMIVPSAGVGTEAPSMATLSSTVSQTMPGCYALPPQPYQLPPGPYTQ
jgi:hypothetical protein